MAFTRKAVDSSIRQTVAAGNLNSQQVAHSHFTRAPLVHEVPQQGFVLASVAGTHYVYTNINGVLFKAAFSPA